MKLNKFKIFAYIGLGLATISAVGTYAGYAGLIVEADPRIYVAAKTADISGQLLDYGGNYLWNQEIQEQNQDYLTTKFRKVRDFKTTLKEGDGCVCEEWNEVSYRSVPLQKLS